MERNFYAKRLFPCWIMASQEPFKDDVGGAALLDAMNAAVARAHFKEVCWLHAYVYISNLQLFCIPLLLLLCPFMRVLSTNAVIVPFETRRAPELSAREKIRIL